MTLELKCPRIGPGYIPPGTSHGYFGKKKQMHQQLHVTKSNTIGLQAYSNEMFLTQGLPSDYIIPFKDTSYT